MPLPLSSLLVILIDLASDVAPSVSFAWEVPEHNLLLFPPRKVLCTNEKNAVSYSLESYPEDIPSTVLSSGGLHASHSHSQEVILPMPGVLDLDDINSMNNRKRGFLYTCKKGYKKILAKCRGAFTNNFSRNETGEVLVDNDLLIWSYLEGGVIISLGCFGAYLMTFYLYDVPLNFLWNSTGTYFHKASPPIILTNGEIATGVDQERILKIAQSSFYMGIVIQQIFALFAIKHKYEYPYGWNLFKNKKSIIAIFISMVIACVVVYTRPFNIFVPSEPVPMLCLLIPLIGGIFLIIYEFIRKYLRFQGYFGGVPKENANLLELVRTTTTVPTIDYSRYMSVE